MILPLLVWALISFGVVALVCVDWGATYNEWKQGRNR